VIFHQHPLFSLVLRLGGDFAPEPTDIASMGNVQRMKQTQKLSHGRIYRKYPMIDVNSMSFYQHPHSKTTCSATWWINRYDPFQATRKLMKRKIKIR